MDGDIDKALKRTHAYYPQVLQDQSPVYFRLRCQKFIEMIRQTAELLDAPPSKSGKDSNGRAPSSMDHEDMEVDEQKYEADDWDKMETEEADTSVKHQELLNETVQYGQVLKREFQDDPSTENTFKEIFSLFQYADPRNSPQAHLLDRASRVPVAEELNSAILGESFPSHHKLLHHLTEVHDSIVSLGKSSSAAIEILYQQTEVLVDLIGETGGAGAFINVRNEFLR